MQRQFGSNNLVLRNLFNSVPAPRCTTAHEQNERNLLSGLDQLRRCAGWLAERLPNNIALPETIRASTALV